MATSPDNGFALPNQSSYWWKCCAGSIRKHKISVDGTNQWKKADMYKELCRGCTQIRTPDLTQWEQQTVECILHEGERSGVLWGTLSKAQMDFQPDVNLLKYLQQRLCLITFIINYDWSGYFCAQYHPLCRYSSFFLKNETHPLVMGQSNLHDY